VRAWLVDIAAGIGIALLVVMVMLFAAFDSTFIYRGF
jgi:hypothetical protein